VNGLTSHTVYILWAGSTDHTHSIHYIGLLVCHWQRAEPEKQSVIVKSVQSSTQMNINYMQVSLSVSQTHGTSRDCLVCYLSSQYVCVRLKLVVCQFLMTCRNHQHKWMSWKQCSDWPSTVACDQNHTVNNTWCHNGSNSEPESIIMNSNSRFCLLELCDSILYLSESLLQLAAIKLLLSIVRHSC